MSPMVILSFICCSNLVRCTCCLLPFLLYDILAVGSLTAKQQVPRTHNLPLTFEDGRTLVQSGDCTVLLVESMPENLTYWAGAPKHVSTHFAWSLLLDQASHQLSIASFYWSLLADAAFNQSDVSKGRAIFDALMNKSGEINITIAQNGSQVKNEELDALQTKGARVFWIDVSRLLGRGVLHTKLWIVDDSHAYVGSANMDWRSLTEVKELGALILNCPALVEDLKKIHASYLLVSDKLPTKWPTELKTSHNRTNPMQITINGMLSKVYFSASPKEFNADGRTHDLDAILSAITEATKYIYISVMDYSSEIVSYDWHTTGRYWPDIDEALRTAAIDRGVEVRLLISRWPHTSKSSLKYQSSLRALNGVQGSTIRIRYFVVPSFTPAQKMIPHARVNHNKYMVTDQVAYIGTSNWSGDYFLFTGGIGFVIRDETKDNSTYEHLQDPETKSQTIRIQLTEIFLRDWNSEYSFEE
ncbi:unnamed protein product [Dicrocoelium dendriticum]|nr:unnamed protein product [Dicrocoelium dendriticum]